MKNTITIILLIIAYTYSATNDTTIDNATLKRIFMGNYAYSTIVSSAPILTMRWASDLNRPVFKSRAGGVYKGMIDASTSSNTPSTRVFFADANGAASSSANLTFSSDKLNITGKIAVSDSVNGGNAKFTGRITGTDIDVDDTVRGTHGYFTWGINTDGDIVAGGHGTFSGELTGASLNTGNGANELYPMNQAVTTTSDVTFDSTRTRVNVVDSIKLGTGSYITADANGAYFKNAVSASFINSEYGVDVNLGGYFTGPLAQNHQWYMGGHAVAYNNGPNQFRIDGPRAGAALRIDSSGIDSALVISNDTVKVKNIKAVGTADVDSIKLGTGSYLKTYVEGSFPCTLKTNNVTVQQVGIAYYNKIGKTMTISFPRMFGISNSSTLSLSCVLPYTPRQLDDGYYSEHKDIKIINAGGKDRGYVEITGFLPTVIVFTRYDGSFATSGHKGFYPFTISYITE